MLTAEEAKAIALAIRDLGLFYAKFVQSISNNSSILGPKASEHLKGFQDALPPMPPEEVLSIIECEYGRPADQVFVEFDAAKPIASATVAQTYKAKVRTRWGWVKTVAVKVQRDGLEEELARNRVLNQILIKSARIFYTDPMGVPIIDFVASQVVGLENVVQEELDFRIEIANMERARSLLRFVPSLGIAKPWKRLSTKRVLVMDWLPGANIDDVVDNEERPLPLKQRKKLFAASLDALIYQVLVFGRLHGDMHPGNILGTDSGRFNIVDWSQVTRLRGLILQPLRALYYLAVGKADKFIQVFLKMGSAKAGLDKDAFTESVKLQLAAEGFVPRTIKELIMDDSQQQDPERLLEVFGTLINMARKEHGFALTPKYFQLGRTALPLLFTMRKLMLGIPKEELKELIKWRLILMAPKIPLQFVGGGLLHLFSKPFQKLMKTADRSREKLPIVQKFKARMSCRKAGKSSSNPEL